jgi:hypothetical protein
MRACYRSFPSITIGFYPKGGITQSDFILLNGLGFMATPAQLVSAISDATGVPLATLVDIDRKLVKANLRAKAGRGLYAARMTPHDAARLLTAILASPQANESASAVLRYAETRLDKARSDAGAYAATGLDDLAALPARHSFNDALAALIASAANGAISRHIINAKKRWMPGVEVFAFTRATRARIRLTNFPNGKSVSVEYAAPSSAKSEAITGGDLEQSRRITEATILPIAKLLADGGEHD